MWHHNLRTDNKRIFLWRQAVNFAGALGLVPLAKGNRKGGVLDNPLHTETPPLVPLGKGDQDARLLEYVWECLGWIGLLEGCVYWACLWASGHRRNSTSGALTIALFYAACHLIFVAVFAIAGGDAQQHLLGVNCQ